MDSFLRPVPHLFARHVRQFVCPTEIKRLSFQSMSTAGPSTISATPVAGQRVVHNGKEYNTIKEGLAYILIPASATVAPQTSPSGPNEAQSVFYNPIQQFNRDLSVLAIKAYGEEVMEKRRGGKFRAPRKHGKKRKRGDNGGEGHGSEKIVRVGAKDSAPDRSNTNTIVDPTASIHFESELLPIDAGKVHEEDRSAMLNSTSTEVELPAPTDQVEAVSMTDSRITVSRDEIEPVDDISNSKTYPPTFTILDALSATGLRALRYVQEIPFTTSVTANDLLATATKTINLNIEHNKLSNKINSTTSNAMAHMYSLVGDNIDNKGRPKPSKKYDVIDLDPYGTAALFLDAAVQAVRDDGGLLCVTCTDAGVWASNSYPEKAYSLYGGVSLKGQHSHEAGLRLILHAIATSAARYGLTIEPLLSLSIDYYARVFVLVRKSAADVKFLAGKTMMVYNCDSGCGAWTTQPLAKNKIAPNKKGSGTFYKHVFSLAPTSSEFCEHCGMKTHLSGPMYAGPLHSNNFIRRILDDLPNVSKDTYPTTRRIEGMLQTALEETLPPLDNETENKLEPPQLGRGERNDPAVIDHYPFFFIPSFLSKVVHCITPHENAIRGALKHLGYRVTRSHTKPGTIKTDAPWSVIWEIMREWVRQKAPVKEGAVREGTAGWNILVMGKRGIEAPNGTTTDGDAMDTGTRSTEANEISTSDKPTIVFDEELGKEKDVKKLIRYQVNPRENWGPMNRAKGF